MFQCQQLSPRLFTNRNVEHVSSSHEPANVFQIIKHMSNRRYPKRFRVQFKSLNNTRSFYPRLIRRVTVFQNVFSLFFSKLNTTPYSPQHSRCVRRMPKHFSCQVNTDTCSTTHYVPNLRTHTAKDRGIPNSISNLSKRYTFQVRHVTQEVFCFL